MAVFFTSDTHFGHAGALSLYRRPFGSVAEMNEALIAGWNATVAPGDEVWHLGDFSLRQKPEDVADTLARLNGNKHLVFGNNDPPATRELAHWVSADPYVEITADGTPLVLCHYPFRTWNGMGKGWLNLHGHSHGRLASQPRQFDVGVDARGFRPIALAELLGSRRKIVENRPTR
jgi:calcineurin-like phosphoesterase family protein